MRVEALEAQFRAEWSPRLEEARRKRNEAELLSLRGRGRAALVAASIVALLLFAMALLLLLLSGRTACPRQAYVESLGYSSWPCSGT